MDPFSICLWTLSTLVGGAIVISVIVNVDEIISEKLHKTWHKKGFMEGYIQGVSDSNEHIAKLIDETTSKIKNQYEELKSYQN